MRLFLIFLLVPYAAIAQVNLCIDEKGRKTYTEADCYELGMKPVGVIADIKPKPKRCYDMQSQMDGQRKQIAKLAAERDPMNINSGLKIIMQGELERKEAEYKKECSR